MEHKQEIINLLKKIQYASKKIMILQNVTEETYSNRLITQYIASIAQKERISEKSITMYSNTINDLNNFCLFKKAIANNDINGFLELYTIDNKNKSIKIYLQMACKTESFKTVYHIVNSSIIFTDISNSYWNRCLATVWKRTPMHLLNLYDVENIINLLIKNGADNIDDCIQVASRKNRYTITNILNKILHKSKYVKCIEQFNYEMKLYKILHKYKYIKCMEQFNHKMKSFAHDPVYNYMSYFHYLKVDKASRFEITDDLKVNKSSRFEITDDDDDDDDDDNENIPTIFDNIDENDIENDETNKTKNKTGKCVIS